MRNFRTSIVDAIKIQVVSETGIFQIGDSTQLNPISYALAVQREHELFFSNEGNFGAYRVFTMNIPSEAIHEQMNITFHNENPIIRVNNINILGVTASGIAHIGSTCNIQAETRVKHIRQLLDD